jgi:hypothetical protein
MSCFVAMIGNLIAGYLGARGVIAVGEPEKLGISFWWFYLLGILSAGMGSFFAWPA